MKTEYERINAKEYLSQALWLDQRIDSKLQQLDSLRSLAIKVTTNFTQERVSGGNDVTSSVEKAIVKIVDLENEINEDIDELVDLKKDILQTINLLSDINYRLILEMRYISGKSWEEISEELNYSIRGIYKIHGKALKKIEEYKSVQ